MTSERLRLRVADVIRETGDAHSIVFDIPAGLTYQPGQFLTLRLPHADGPVARCYSLSSAPGVDEQLKVTVKRVKDGRGSNWVCDTVLVGHEIDVLAPSGTFTPKSLDADLLLLAGGSGITPVMSIIKSALARGTGRMLLVYANRDEQSVIFHADLRALVAAHPDRLIVLHWLETVQGLPSLKPLQELVRPWAHAEAFICGPAPFMDCAAEALKSLGILRDRIHVERFTSLAGDPWTEVEVAAPVAGERTVDLVVELDGDTHELDWPESSKLLDLLLGKGLDAPYSCREGACSACGVILVEGEVVMENNSVLEKEDLDEGWRLACQSRPVSDVVKVRYS
ncbi:MAG: Phenylacetate-CoA oxygenase/reductase, PaaK subunit [Frankiales bacterium]|nr:Phenylacetate-CoA oxygenase/reductase, PaaK subunit [Frankiales bacterium]